MSDLVRVCLALVDCLTAFWTKSWADSRGTNSGGGRDWSRPSKVDLMGELAAERVNKGNGRLDGSIEAARCELAGTLKVYAAGEIGGLGGRGEGTTLFSDNRAGEGWLTLSLEASTFGSLYHIP